MSRIYPKAEWALTCVLHMRAPDRHWSLEWRRVSLNLAPAVPSGHGHYSHLGMEGTEVQRGGFLVQSRTAMGRAEILNQEHLPLRHQERRFCKGHCAHCQRSLQLPQSIWCPRDLDEVGSLPLGLQGKPPSSPVQQPQGRAASLHPEGVPASPVLVRLPLAL